MSDKKTAILIAHRGKHYKITSVIFGSDGSYMIPTPFAASKQVMVSLITCDYDAGTSFYARDTAVIESGVTEEARIKLSYHRSGAVQFSGGNLVSGFNPDGSPKGIAIQSAPLNLGRRLEGPAWGVTVSDIRLCPEVDNKPKRHITINVDPLLHEIEPPAVSVEGHFFPASYRRYIIYHGEGDHRVAVEHPSGREIEMRVVYPPDKLSQLGFFAIRTFVTPSLVAPTTSGEAAKMIPFQYSISGPGGSGRICPETGHRLGDVIMAAYPAPEGCRVSKDLTLPPPSTD